jgi:hypothetical protein
MRFRDAAVLLFALTLLGCVAPFDPYIRIPDPDPATNEQPPLIPGWKCPAPKDTTHFTMIPNPPCSWVPGGVLLQSCRKSYVERHLEAEGCVRVPNLAVWYMLVPPDGARPLNPNESLQNWPAIETYKTEPECQTALTELKSSFGVARRRLEVKELLPNFLGDRIPAGIPYAKCASSDVARPDGYKY